MGSSLRVAAGHDERLNSRISKEQMLQRRVGQIDTEPGNAWRDGIRDSAARARASEDDGPRVSEDERFLFRREFAEGARCIEIADHDGERLAVAVLALAQAHHGGLARGVDGEVESADAFGDDDFAGHQAIDRCGHGIGGWNLSSIRRDEPDMRAADGAGVGLRVKAAVGGVVVFSLAGRAHFEARHGGLRAIVGDAARDGEARAAVGAVEKRIAVATVIGIKQLAQAVGAGGRVGRNAGGDVAARITQDDAKFLLLSWGNVAMGHAIDARERWGFGAQAHEKNFNTDGRALDLDGDAAGIVADGAGESLF